MSRIVELRVVVELGSRAVDSELRRMSALSGFGRPERRQHALRKLGDMLDDASDGADELVELGVAERTVLGDPLWTIARSDGV